MRWEQQTLQVRAVCVLTFFIPHVPQVFHFQQVLCLRRKKELSCQFQYIRKFRQGSQFSFKKPLQSDRNIFHTSYFFPFPHSCPFLQNRRYIMPSGLLANWSARMISSSSIQEKSHKWFCHKRPHNEELQQCRNGQIEPLNTKHFKSQPPLCKY